MVVSIVASSEYIVCAVSCGSVCDVVLKLHSSREVHPVTLGNHGK